MKQLISVLFLIAMVLGITGCSQETTPATGTSVLSSTSAVSSTLSTSNQEDTKNLTVYDAFLRNMAKENAKAMYSFYDMDQDGNNELLMQEQCVVTVYQYQNNRVVLLDSYDFVSATFELHYGNTKEDGSITDTNPYPGVFTRTTGGGQNHYGILTLENGKLVHTPL